jgi:hypothetical protein
LESANRLHDLGAGGAGAFFHPARRAAFSCGVDRENRMGRDGVSLVRSWARTREIMTTIGGWATAESSAAGYGADRDRVTSVPSRSSSVSCWRRWIRAWGSDEPVSDDPAA